MLQSIKIIGLASILLATVLITVGCGAPVAKDPNRPMLADVKIGLNREKAKGDLTEDTKILEETKTFGAMDDILVDGVAKNLKAGMTIDAGIYENGEEVIGKQIEVENDTVARYFIFLLGSEDPLPAGVWPLEVKIISPDGTENDDMYFMKMITIE